ncbi:ras-like protein rasb [Anaeramoeba ignava]|uniref:Ras-like protein rasb n=1 Tax=Anaeramoeba ignava TaxID=1746090 RepID=A0A9Q0LEP4_ANAIG|nr:ras-like protein rasb [Anaeramoeba ignava]
MEVKLNDLKIGVYGKDGVGKTAMIFQFINKWVYEEYDPTIDDFYKQQMNINNKNYLLDIHDTVEQDEYTAIREISIKQEEGFMIVYSIDSRESFDSISLFREVICKVQNSEKFPLVIVGNKSDLESQRKVSFQELSDLAGIFSVPFFEVSAKNKQNLNEAFFKLVEEVEKSRAQSQDSQSKKDGRKKGICLMM